jgi:hypothetical protein
VPFVPLALVDLLRKNKVPGQKTIDRQAKEDLAQSRRDAKFFQWSPLRNSLFPSTLKALFNHKAHTDHKNQKHMPIFVLLCDPCG